MSKKNIMFYSNAGSILKKCPSEHITKLKAKHIDHHRRPSPICASFFKFNLKSLGPLCRLLHTKRAKFNFSDKRSKLNQVPPVPTY